MLMFVSHGVLFFFADSFAYSGAFDGIYQRIAGKHSHD
jgi:hypothetical protein